MCVSVKIFLFKTELIITLPYTDVYKRQVLDDVECQPVKCTSGTKTLPYKSNCIYSHYIMD